MRNNKFMRLTAEEASEHFSKLMSEAELQNNVIDLAHILGWKIVHFRPAMTLRGWRTPVSADGKGFKDLVLVRERVIWAECKTERGVITSEQQNWHSWLIAAKQEAYIWRPKDLEKIKQILT